MTNSEAQKLLDMALPLMPQHLQTAFRNGQNIGRCSSIHAYVAHHVDGEVLDDMLNYLDDKEVLEVFATGFIFAFVDNVMALADKGTPDEIIQVIKESEEQGLI